VLRLAVTCDARRRAERRPRRLRAAWPLALPALPRAGAHNA